MLTTTRPMFQFPLPVDDLFAERTDQFIGWGISGSVVRDVRRRVTDAWSDGPYGWTYEWMAAAKALEQRGRWREAALAYGAARFPSLASPSRVAAYEEQQRSFAHVAERTDIERQILEIDYRSGSVPVAVHRYRCHRPSVVLCLTGGVDTWKVELHRLATTFRRLGRLEVVLFDMPGTGESTVPLAHDADEIYRGVAAAMRREGIPVGVMGMSFGGLWTAKLAMHGGADFAIDLGGPVGATARTADDLLSLPNGMTGIVASALWLDALPTPDELPALLEQFSLADDFASGRRHLEAPLLVANGSDDQYIPRLDTEIFREYPHATVLSVAGATHCAAEKIVPVMVAILAWIRMQSRRSVLDRGLARVTASLV